MPLGQSQCIPQADPGGMATPRFWHRLPRNSKPAANSGSWGEADVVSKVLDAASELGNDAGLVAFDKKIGAEVLVECAILEHGVGGSQQRGRHCDGSLFGSASSFEAEELCLIVGTLGACCA